MLRAVALRHDAEAPWADQHAGGNVAQHAPELQLAKQRNDDDGGEQEDGDEHEHGGGPCNDACVPDANLLRCPRLRKPIGSTATSTRRTTTCSAPAASDITLVEYGSYACPYCRAANEEIARLRDRFGDRLRYVFRQRPITGSDIARRAADIAESAPDSASFWDAHVKLMTRSATLTEDDLASVADKFGVDEDTDRRAGSRARSTRTSQAHARAACM